MDDNRRNNDRRQYLRRPEYPLVDCNGTVVTTNRRRILDRRMTEPAQDPTPVSMSGGFRLMLRFKGKVREFTELPARIEFGRHPGCAIMVDERYVSREHGYIAVRDGKIRFTDRSTNGTYIRFNGSQHDFIIDETMPLSGNGIISVGVPIHEHARNLIYFDCG